MVGPLAAGCYSLSRLLDEQVVAGCEGDVCSALGMLWGQAMTGQTPWMANIAQASQQLAIMPFVNAAEQRPCRKAACNCCSPAFTLRGDPPCYPCRWTLPMAWSSWPT